MTKAVIIVQVASSKLELKDTLSFCVSLKTLHYRLEDITEYFEAVRKPFCRQTLPAMTIFHDQQQSTSASESELFHSRKKSRKHQVEDSEMEDDTVADLPPPKKKKVKITHKSSESESDARIADSPPPLSEIINPSDARDDRIITLITENHRKVMKQIILLRKEMTRLTGTKSTFTYTTIPIENNNELSEFSSALNNQKNYDDTVQLLYVTEGLTKRSFIINMVKRIFGAGIVKQISWSGKKKTIGLKNTKISELILNVAQKKFPDTTVTDVKESVLDFTKHKNQ